MIVKAVTGSAGAVTAFALEFDDEPNGSTNAAATSATTRNGRTMRRTVTGFSISVSGGHTVPKKAVRYTTRCDLGRFAGSEIGDPGLGKVEPVGPGDDAFEVVGAGRSVVVVVLYIEE